MFKLCKERGNQNKWFVKRLFKLDEELHVSHLPGLDNPWAAELSRFEGDLTTLGWNPRRRHVLTLEEVLFPKTGKLFPADAAEKAVLRTRQLAELLQANS